MKFGAPFEDADTGIRVIRVRMFLEGHSFDEIDNTSLSDFADVVAFWTGESKATRKKGK